jgi:hypothetical protein
VAKYRAAPLPLDKPVDPVLLNDILDAIEDNFVAIGNALGRLERLAEQVEELKASLPRSQEPDT